MDNQRLIKAKPWYYDAVISDLILNFALSREEAEEATKAFRLKEKLDLFQKINCMTR